MKQDIQNVKANKVTLIKDVPLKPNFLPNRPHKNELNNGNIKTSKYIKYKFKNFIY